jgi:hypothetical protein
MGNITLLCNVSQLESGCWARVDIPCDYFRPLHCLLHWRSNFVRLKSRGSSELTNISISISIQRICLDLQLMETYVKCLTFAYGILSLSNPRSTPFPTVTALVQRCCPILVHVSQKDPDQSPSPIRPHRTPVYIPANSSMYWRLPIEASMIFRKWRHRYILRAKLLPNLAD